MNSLFVALFALVASSFRTRADLQAEILALRHQLAVFQKNAPRRMRLHHCDWLVWVVLYRFWSGWRRCLQMVQPDTVLRWHRRAFAWHWTRKSRRLPGRPGVASKIRDLIRRMSQANPLWGAPRRRDCQSLDSDMLANNETSVIDEIYDQRATRILVEMRTEFSVMTPSSGLSPLSFASLLFTYLWLAVHPQCIVIHRGMRESDR